MTLTASTARTIAQVGKDGLLVCEEQHRGRRHFHLHTPQGAAACALCAACRRRGRDFLKE